jgi:hypothetical protein
MSASKEFNKARALFMKRASAPELPASVLKLAYLIAYTHMDSDSETARVGQKRLAADLKVTIRAVQKLTVMLRRFGLEVETGKGPEQANVYRIGDPPAAENANYSSPISVENTNCSSPIEAENTNWSDIKTRTGETENANCSSPLLNKSLQEEPPRKGRDISPPVAALGVKKARKRLAAEGSKPEAAPSGNAGTAEAEDDELRASFSEFKGVYPNKVGIDKAWDEYRRVVVDLGVSPDLLNNRAQVYAITEQWRIERSKDPQRQRGFTKQAKNWLKEGWYNNPLPDGAAMDENGLATEIKQEDGEEESFETAYAKYLQRTGGPSW